MINRRPISLLQPSIAAVTTEASTAAIVAPKVQAVYDSKATNYTYVTTLLNDQPNATKHVLCQ
jgi:hypothetical protein